MSTYAKSLKQEQYLQLFKTLILFFILRVFQTEYFHIEAVLSLHPNPYLGLHLPTLLPSLGL